MTKEQIETRKRKPYGVAKGAEQDRRQREHAKLVKASSKLREHDDLTLTPAGKFTDAMASDIFNALDARKLPDGHLLVKNRQFENKERVMEAIHNAARPLQFELKKQPRRKRKSG